MDNKWEREAYCLQQVLIDGLKLKHVVYQTPDIVALAVSDTTRAMEFVRVQSECIQLQAAKANGLSLRHMTNPTLLVTRAALRQNGYALYYVKDKTYKHCMHALEQNRLAHVYVDYSQLTKDESNKVYNKYLFGNIVAPKALDS